MIDDAPSTAAPEETGAATPAAAAAAPKAAAFATAEETAEQAPAAPDPRDCPALAIGLDALWEGVFSGEWDDSDFDYYLEPDGVLSGPLVCSRSPENEPRRAGLLITRAGWQAKLVFLDDGVNPESYELSFPKEFGYVKPLAHYKPETRERATFPWSKKY